MELLLALKKTISNIANIFAFILILILEFICFFGIKLTIYYFTPCHYFILEYIWEYINYIKYAINSDEEFYSTGNVIIFSVAFLINLFCCLVFNEVLILNFWKLDYNTKQRIQERMTIADNPDDDETSLKQISDENVDEN